MDAVVTKKPRTAAKPEPSADDLHRQVEAAKRLRLQIAAMVAGGDIDPAQLSEDDAQALQDTFDGETTLDAELRNALICEDEDRILIDGIKAREADLTERRRRAEKRIEVRRGLMEQAMAVAGWKKHSMDIGTISLGKAKPRLEVTDEAAIPSQFFKVPPPPDPALDKSGLTSVLTERHEKMTDALAIEDEAERAAAVRRVDLAFPEIPGAHLETGGVTMTIRRK